MTERFETFTVMIAKISRNIRKIKAEEMAEYNLKSTHVSCLYYLYKEESLTAKEICDRCEEDKAAISRAIDYLEKKDYLEREKSNGKRYKSHLTLTEKGKEIGEKISIKIDRILEQVSVGLTEDERGDFYKSLSIINDSLDALANRSEVK